MPFSFHFHGKSILLSARVPIVITFPTIRSFFAIFIYICLVSTLPNERLTNRTLMMRWLRQLMAWVRIEKSVEIRRKLINLNWMAWRLIHITSLALSPGSVKDFLSIPQIHHHHQLLLIVTLAHMYIHKTWNVVRTWKHLFVFLSRRLLICVLSFFFILHLRQLLCDFPEFAWNFLCGSLLCHNMSHDQTIR